MNFAVTIRGSGTMERNILIAIKSEGMKFVCITLSILNFLTTQPHLLVCRIHRHVMCAESNAICA